MSGRRKKSADEEAIAALRAAMERERRSKEKLQQLEAAPVFFFGTNYPRDRKVIDPRQVDWSTARFDTPEEMTRERWAEVYLAARERGRIVGCALRGEYATRKAVREVKFLEKAARALPRDPCALGWLDGLDADSLVWKHQVP